MSIKWCFVSYLIITCTQGESQISLPHNMERGTGKVEINDGIGCAGCKSSRR